MIITTLLLAGMACALGGALLMFAALTGEPPTPRRILTRITQRIQVLRTSTTIPRGPGVP